MSEPMPLSGVWWNGVFEDAFELVEPIIRDIGDTFMDGGFAPTHEAVTLKQLSQIPSEEEAQQVIRQMIEQPYYRQQGFKVLAQILERITPAGGA